MKLLLYALVSSMVGVAQAQHNRASFKARKTSQTWRSQLYGSLGEVFPLFDPINETKWIPEWSIEIIYQENEDKVGEGMLFRTGKGELERLWSILKFDEINGQIQYLYILPDRVWVMIDIACLESNQGVDAQITYTLTAISESGNKLVKELTQEVMAERMSHWENAINSYLALSKTSEHE